MLVTITPVDQAPEYTQELKRCPNVLQEIDPSAFYTIDQKTGAVYQVFPGGEERQPIRMHANIVKIGEEWFWHPHVNLSGNYYSWQPIKVTVIPVKI